MTNRCKAHKFKRTKLSRNTHPVYKCINCPAYYIEPAVIGVLAECWICGAEFKMNNKSLLLKPHCGCKNEIVLERVSQGAGMDDTKDKVLKIRTVKPKTTDPELESAKQSLIDSLLSGFNKR